jgi:hypothetical protein
VQDHRNFPDNWYQSRWACNGEKQVEACDAAVVAAAASGTFTAEEDAGRWQLIVERAVEKVASAGPANYPILTKTNYNQWVLLMRIKMEARGLWAAIDPGSVEFQVDRMALDVICSAVPPEMITALAMKDSAQEAWESIKVMRIGDDRIRMVSAQKVQREDEVLEFHNREGVEDFAMQLSGIVNQLAVLGDPEPDDKVILKFLRIARPRFKQLVISIETLLDVSSLSLEEVTGRLRKTVSHRQLQRESCT